MLDEASVAQAFRYASEVLFVDSPLYRQLSGKIAEAPELVAIAAHAMPGQSPPLLLLAAVHFQALRGAGHPLTDLYRDLAAGRPVPAEVWPCFVDFCRRHRESLASFVASSRVQTNELGRAVYLRLGAEWVIERFRPQAISWLEVGASAGLNLYWDRFWMEFSRSPSEWRREWRRGDPASGVRLSCRLEGEETPVEREAPPPELVERLGVDIAPLDVRDDLSLDRLAAFVWADHRERLERLRCAAALFRRGTQTVHKADATRELAGLCGGLRGDTLLCIAHTFLTSQLPAETQDALDGQLALVSRERELVRVAVEWIGDGTQLHVEHWVGGRRSERWLLAHGHPHGHTLSWCPDSR